MSNLDFNDELISAYLDGELTAAEGERVERLLADDPRCRRTLVQMRALREDLKALPQYSLDADFYQRVLCAAEGKKGGSDVASGHGALGEEAAGPAAVWLARRSWRGPLWGLVALAAAVLIMFLLPGNPRVGDVARGPAEQPTDRSLDRQSAEPALAAEAEPLRRKSAALAEQTSDTSELSSRDSDGIANGNHGEAGAITEFYKSAPDVGVAEVERQADSLGAGLNQAAKNGLRQQAQEPAQPDTYDLVVHVQLGEDAGAQAALMNTLAQQPMANRFADEAEGLIAPAPEELSETDSNLARQPAGGVARRARWNAPYAPRASAQQHQLIAADLTPTQVQATLGQLRSQRRQFPTVEVFTNFRQTTAQPLADLQLPRSQQSKAGYAGGDSNVRLPDAAGPALESRSVAPGPPADDEVSRPAVDRAANGPPPTPDALARDQQRGLSEQLAPAQTPYGQAVQKAEVVPVTPRSQVGVAGARAEGSPGGGTNASTTELSDEQMQHLLGTSRMGQIDSAQQRPLRVLFIVTTPSSSSPPATNVQPTGDGTSR